MRIGLLLTSLAFLTLTLVLLPSRHTGITSLPNKRRNSKDPNRAGRGDCLNRQGHC